MTLPVSGGVPEQGLREPAETISANSPWAIENEEALSAAYAVAFDKWRIVQPPYKASFRAMVRTAIHAYLAALERPRPALPPLESWHKHECRGSSTDSEAHDPCFCVCGATSNDRGKTWAALPAPEPPPQKCDNCGRSPGSGKGSSAFTVCNDCWDARGAALPAEPQGISGASLPGLDCVAPLYVPKYRPSTEEEKRAARTVVPAEHAPPDLKLAEIRARLDAATPAPWAWTNNNDKDYGASVGAEVFAEDDMDAERPLSGNLSERTDDYHVLESIADLDGQPAARNADFIAHAPDDIRYLLDLAGSRPALAGSPEKAEEYLRTLQWPDDDLAQGVKYAVETHVRYFARWLTFQRDALNAGAGSGAETPEIQP